MLPKFGYICYLKERFCMISGRDKYRFLVENLPDAFAYHQIVTDSENRPVDYIFLKINSAFEEMTGLSRDSVIGKKVTEVHPDIKESSFDWIGTYGKVASTGKSTHFEQYFEVADRWYDITAYSDEPGYFAVVFRDSTENKKVEMALRENEAFIKSVMDNLPIGIAVNSVDPTVKFEYMNDNFYNFYQTTREALTDTDSFWEVVYEDAEFREKLKQRVLEDCASGDPERMHWEDVPITRKGKETFYITAKNIPVPGKPLVISTVSDVTERKRAEKALRENEENLATTLHSIGDAVIATDEEGLIARMNPMAEKLCGWPFSEARGKPLADVFRIIDSKTRKPASNPVKTVLENGEVIGLANHTALISRDGTEYQIADSAAPIKNYDEIITGVVLVFSDVSEDYALRRKIEESELRWQFALEGSGDGVWDLNVQTGQAFFSRQWKKMLGYEEHEIGNDIEEWDKRVHPEDKRKCYAFLEKHFRGETPDYQNEHRILCKNGIYKWILARGKVIEWTGGGEPLRVIGTHTDITERKQTEEKIRYMSFHDSLTDLYNRRYMEEEMKRLDVERQLPISVIISDLNGLKLVNDTYGHSVGDEMLKHTAEVIKNSCRQEDIIARWGGDEFVILLPQTTKMEALSICKRINYACSKTYVEDIPISIALGSEIKDSAEKNLTETLKEAEDNMYKHKLTESRSAKSAVLNSLLKTLGAKSHETEEHTRRMQDVALKIGEKVELPDSELHRLGILTTLHDIGKINIPENILIKKEALTQEEWEIIKKHPEIGYRIARSTEEFSHVAEDILAHHERWDGSGYPRGLKGKEITLLARITAIADAYEVMTNGRPYRKALPQSEVITELKRCAGTHFDPDLIEVFLCLHEESVNNSDRPG
ncbi:MAG: PAS domain S-box protein [Firmicutes bacterium]|nr:PAS domain S-box protein [Bacillota bacterium]